MSQNNSIESSYYHQEENVALIGKRSVRGQKRSKDGQRFLSQQQVVTQVKSPNIIQLTMWGPENKKNNW